MALRVVKTRVPEERREELVRLTDDLEVINTWATRPGDETVQLEFLVDLEKTEPLIEAVESRFGANPDFRVVIENVEATVPRPEPEEEEEVEEPERAEEDEEVESAPPINIEELYESVTDGMEIDAEYTVFVVLSTVVAAVGLIRDDVAMVIAAMIIAPLLRPNISLSLATTLADAELARRSLVVNVYGITLAVGIAALFGFAIPYDAAVPQIALRTKYGVLELLLAGSAGVAAAMSFTAGRAERMVGVMVAVALLPPVVAFGMLLGDGAWRPAVGAALLTIANVVCLNLTGVVTFFLQHVRPRNAWESERAKRAIRTAIAIWVALLAVLVALIVFGGEFRRYP